MKHDATLTGLNTYPVKGLSAQTSQRIDLTAGQGFPGDRMFGFARAGSGFDSNDPKPMPKHNFLVLAQEAMLAKLETSFDPATQSMQIVLDGTPHSFDLSADTGREEAASFMSEHLGLGTGKTPGFVHAQPHRFTDVSVVSEQMMHAVSILNLDSLRAFEAATRQTIDPARFRANIVIDGLPAFSELDMLEEEINIGAVRMKIIFHTRRCAATQVNLKTAERDLDIPRLLHTQYGHMNMGVYAEVLKGGTISVGDTVY